jgi:pyridoxal biosynthesis lyase PdxS
MLAAPAEDVDSAAALVAVPVVLAEQQVPAQLRVVVGLARVPVPVDLVARVQLPVLADLVVQAAVEAVSVEAAPVELLLRRQSFSAAMARSTP